MRVGAVCVPLGVAVLAATFGVLIAAVGPDVRAGAQEASGAELFAANCAGCHQPDGGGIPGAFPPLAGNPAATDPEYVSTVIVEGKSGPIDVLGATFDGVMPPIVTLTPDQVASIAEHVAGLASGDVSGEATGDDLDASPGGTPVPTIAPSPPSGGDAEAGHDLFVGSNGLDAGGIACASCHVAGDVGNLGGSSLGPDLTGVYGRLGGEPGMTAWLGNPGSPTMRPIFEGRPMTEDEIADLVAFFADAPERDQPSDTFDALMLLGFVGFVALLGAMAIAWRGMRQPYARTLASTTRSPR
jgi:mono/diheme cytochrome c family protein